MGWTGSFTRVNANKSCNVAQARQGYIGHKQGADPSEQVLSGQINSYVDYLFSSNEIHDYSKRDSWPIISARVRESKEGLDESKFAGDVLFFLDDHKGYATKGLESVKPLGRRSFAERLTHYQDLYGDYNLDVRHYGQDDFVSVVLKRKDGTSYAGTFATPDAIREIMQKEGFTAAPGLVVVDDLSPQNIRDVVKRIIERCSLDRNFVYLPDEETG